MVVACRYQNAADIRRLPDDYEKKVPRAILKQGEDAGLLPVHIYDKYGKRIRCDGYHPKKCEKTGKMVAGEFARALPMKERKAGKRY